MRKIKMIWDFRGNEAEPTAKHHAIHLEQFANKHNLDFKEVGIEKQTEMHCIAYLMCTDNNLVLVRDSLKPHRATLEE